MYREFMADLKAGGDERLQNFGRWILKALEAIGINLTGGRIAVSAPITPKATAANTDTNELEQEIKDLKARLAKLEERVGANDEDLDDFEERLDKLEKNGGTPAEKPAEPKTDKKDKSGKGKKKIVTTDDEGTMEGPADK